MAKPLSHTMVAVLDMANAAGGKLVRYQGGYWAGADAGHPKDRHDGEYAGTPTIEALVARGAMIYTRWTTGRRGQFPTQAEVVVATIGKVKVSSLDDALASVGIKVTFAP